MSGNAKNRRKPPTNAGKNQNAQAQLPKVEVNVHIDTQPLPKVLQGKPQDEKRLEPFWQKLILTLLGSSLFVALVTGASQASSSKGSQVTSSATSAVSATFSVITFPTQVSTATSTLVIPLSTASAVPSALASPNAVVASLTPMPSSCLSSEEWEFFPEHQVNQNPCLDLVKWFITHDEYDGFRFFAQEFKESNVFGVSREVPRNAEIEASFYVNELKGGGRLWLAIASDANPRKESVLLTILPESYIAVRLVRDGVERNLSDPKVPYFQDSRKNRFNVQIKLNGNQVAISLNGVHISSVAINFSTRRLFIGYQTVRNPKLSISAKLDDLTVK